MPYFIIILLLICGSHQLHAQNSYAAPPFLFQKVEYIMGDKAIFPYYFHFDITTTDAAGNTYVNLTTDSRKANFDFENWPVWTEFSQFAKYFQVVIDSSFSDSIRLRSMIKSNSLRYGTSSYFPQSNGDTMYIGYSDGSIGLSQIAFELRDSNKNIKHFKEVGGFHVERPSRFFETKNGGYIGIANYTGFGDGDIGMGDSIKCGEYHANDIWLFKTDSLGNVLKSRVFGGIYDDNFGDVYIDSLGNIFVMLIVTSGGIDCELDGCISSKTGWDDLLPDLLLVKLDSDLNILWSKCYGGNGVEGWAKGAHMVPDGNQGFYIAARTSSTDGDLAAHPFEPIPGRTILDPTLGGDIWVFQIDSIGQILQSVTFPFNRADVADITRTADGHIWVGVNILDGLFAGLTHDEPYGYEDGVVLHLDSTLQLVHKRTLGGIATDLIYNVVALQDTSVLITLMYRGVSINDKRTPGLPPAISNNDVSHAVVFIKAKGVTDSTLLPKPAPLSIMIYPNPVDAGILHISLPHPENIQLQITDASGRLLLRRMVPDQYNTIDIATLASGVYIVQLIDTASKQVIAKEKIVVSKR